MKRRNKMYKGKDNEVYGDLEESILACLLLNPNNMKKLIVEEKHFKKFGYLFVFMNEFYKKYHNFDTTLMLAVVKGNDELTILDAITYLLDIFVIPTHFMDYQNKLIDMYGRSKKEEWLRKKIYEKATRLYVGSISVEQYNEEIKRLYEHADRIPWR